MRVLLVGSSYFVRLLRFFRILWRHSKDRCGLRARDKFTLEKISALFGISELQSVIDCLTETRLETVSAGWTLEPIGTKTRN